MCSSLLLLLFVVPDNRVILAENDRDLQMTLDSVHEYCTKYKLTVNTRKTDYDFLQKKI